MNRHPSPSNRPSRAFTLIELLVVIAIVAILAAILFPVFGQAKAAAKKAACLSNTKQVGLALQLYLGDNDDVYPGPAQYEPQPAGTAGDTPFIPYDLLLMPYLKSTAILFCPADSPKRPSPASAVHFWDAAYRARSLPRSYQYVAGIYTVEGGASQSDPNTGLGTFYGAGYPASRIDQPSSTVALVEVWGPGLTLGDSSYVGSDDSSVFTECDAWKLAGRKSKVATGSDALPPGCAGYEANVTPVVHGNGSNYVLADTSAKYRTWSQVRANDFAMFKLQKSSQTFVP